MIKVMKCVSNCCFVAEGACVLCRTSVDYRERFGEIRTPDGLTILTISVQYGSASLFLLCL